MTNIIQSSPAYSDTASELSVRIVRTGSADYHHHQTKQRTNKIGNNYG